jgi:hypothetical protein
MQADATKSKSTAKANSKAKAKSKAPSQSWPLQGQNLSPLGFFRNL